MSNQTINDLDDDCLFAVFTRLNVIDKLIIRLVSKRWLELTDSYNIFVNQKSLGTVASFSCYNESHIVYSRDVIDRLFFYGQPSNRSVFKGKFDLNVHKLNIILKKCPDLRSLVLKFCKSMGDDIAHLISTSCMQLEHLDLSMTFFDKSNSVLSILSKSIATNLLHLNLFACEGLDEQCLGELLRNCTALEEFVVGRNGAQISGRFLAYFNSETIRKVSIYGIDEFVHSGVSAITSLASGKGHRIEELKIKGQLSVDLIRKVVEKFPLLKSLEAGDFFTDAWIDGSHTAIGRSISQLSCLEELAFELPELIQFDGNILELIRGCSNLRKFKMQGGPINDLTVQLLCKWCPFLERVALIYTKYFPSHRIRPTGEGLSALASLKHLNQLAVNGTHINDDAFTHILSSCKNLSLIDVRDSPELTCEALDACFTAASGRPGTQLHVYVAGTEMESSYDAKDIELPRNLTIIDTPREETDDDIGYSNEEFEIEGQYFDEVPNGLIVSDQFRYEQPEDGIRYSLEDLDI